MAGLIQPPFLCLMSGFLHAHEKQNTSETSMSSLSLMGHGAEQRQRSRCSLVAGKGPSGLWDTCPIFSQEICRNLLTPLTKHSTTLDQRCSLTGARHRSVWTMYSWALVEAMPSGEHSRLRLSAPNTCWFPCVHWQERTCRILVLQDSPNTALDVLRASAHFKGASEIHNLTYTWEGKNNCLSYRWENDTEKINIKTKDLMAEWEQVPR